MRLVIEDGDYSKVGLPAGEYDLDDLGAVRGAKIIGGQPGAHRGIEIELRLNSGMTPEPGSTGEPHYKFGVNVEDAPVFKSQRVTAFGRTDAMGPGNSLGYKVDVLDEELAVANDPRLCAKSVIEKAVRSVADEMVKVLVEIAIDQVTSAKAVKASGAKTGRLSSNQQRQDAFFGLGKKDAKKCDECRGSGEWTNPANGAKSPCSKGCPK